MWNRFAPRLRHCIFSALELAGQAGDEQATPEDLLAAILLDSESAAAFVVEYLGGSAAAVAERVRRAPSNGGRIRERATGFSSGVMRVLDGAKGQSEKVHDLHIGSEHVLEAMLQVGAESTARAIGWMKPADVDHAMRQFAKLKMPRGRSALTRLTWRLPMPRRLSDPLHRTLRVAALAYGVYVRKSLGHPGFVNDPYPLYARLRRREPVRRDPIAPVWVLTRYEDVAAYLRDPRFKKDPFSLDELPERAREQMEMPEEPARGFMPQGPQSMLFLDPPRHTRIRALFNKAFTPRTLQRLRPRIEQITARRLDGVQARGGMDLIRELAYPLPTVVIAELLGFPPEDYERLKRWSDDFAATLSFGPTAKQATQAQQSREEMRVYFDGIAERLRASPQDNLISVLLAAEIDQSRLSKTELFANCVLLMAAGHETTTNLIGNGMLALLRHPDQLKLLREEPALIETAVEELLRYDSPVQWTSRVAAEDIVIGGRKISRGDMVVASLGAANRDPAQFADPDRLDIRRAENRHFAFGAGIHFCLGAALARMEGEIAIAATVQRLPNLRLAKGKLKWRPGGVFRGVETLEVEWG